MMKTTVKYKQREPNIEVGKTEQEVCDDLSVFMLNIFPKVSSLPTLLAINLVKVEGKIFQTFMLGNLLH